MLYGHLIHDVMKPKMQDVENEKIQEKIQNGKSMIQLLSLIFGIDITEVKQQLSK